MIISVSSDKNLRISQMFGGAVGPNVVIGQFESTGDAKGCPHFKKVQFF